MKSWMILYYIFISLKKYEDAIILWRNRETSIIIIPQSHNSKIKIKKNVKDPQNPLYIVKQDIQLGKINL